MDRMTLEQRRAVAVATARLRLQQAAVTDSVDAGSEPSMLEGLGAGAVRGAARIGNTLLDTAAAPVGLVAPELASQFHDWRQGGMDQLDEQYQNSTAYDVGDIAMQIAGTAGVGGAMGAAVKGVSQAPKAIALANAMKTGGLGMTAKGASYPVRVLAGAATGAGAAGLTHPDEMGLGAAIGGALPGVAPVVSGTANFVKNAFGPASEAWRVGQGRKFFSELLGPAKQDVVDAISARLPGSTTVGDDIAAATMGKSQKFGSPLVAVEEVLSAQPSGISDAAKSINAAQEKARMSLLRSVQPNLDKAVARREAATAPLYEKAKNAVVRLDEKFMQIFERMPKGTLEKAADIARMDGRSFQVGEFVPAHMAPSSIKDAAGRPLMVKVPAQYPRMTGENLHYIKRALSDIANQPAAAGGAGRDAQSAARGVLGDFVSAFEDKVRAYGVARKRFSQLSKPIDQAKVLQSMQDVLSGQGGAERVTAFMNVLGRGEKALLKRSTGFPRYESGDLSKILTPKQMQAVSRVGKELSRDLERKMLGKSVETRHILEIANKGKGSISLPNLLSRPAMLANWVMHKMGKGADELIAHDIADLMINDPAAFSAKYLQDASGAGPASALRRARSAIADHAFDATPGVSPAVIEMATQ